MSSDKVRVRFAPAPTGIMHIGNIRTALMNYLFAQQKNGTFVLRIEDTDPQRNYDPEAKKIIEDLGWLGIDYNEGPVKGGPHEPYFQSQRAHIYEEHLQKLIEKKCVYRCFCSEEELEKKRERQRALKLPPRYDRACMRLPEQKVQHQLEHKRPFIWRFKLDHDVTIDIKDLAHDKVHFELKNFSDFPLTRRDGTFTFMFANFVDDLVMNITHVFRGEDHLSNSAGQAALYQAFDTPLPIFWHMPILTNIAGKKLSKRDFGFSLHDLKEGGFVPEAIVNYLTIIGGSFEQEIMDMKELAHAINFDELHATGQIKYDVEKLTWINRHWIAEYNPEKLATLARPFLQEKYAHVKEIDAATLAHLLQKIKTDLPTLKESVDALSFYFDKPEVSAADIQACIATEYKKPIAELTQKHLNILGDATDFANKLKEEAKQAKIPLKQLFWFVRLALMGSTQGPTIHDLVAMLGEQESRERIEKTLDLLSRV